MDTRLEQARKGAAKRKARREAEERLKKEAQCAKESAKEAKHSAEFVPIGGNTAAFSLSLLGRRPPRRRPFPFMQPAIRA